MIVLDASAAIELLLRTPTGDDIARRIADELLATPHLVDVEVAQVMRRYERAGAITASRARQLLADLVDLDATATPTTSSSAACGSCAPTSPPTTRRTSLSQRLSEPPWSRAMHVSRERQDIARGSSGSRDPVIYRSPAEMLGEALESKGDTQGACAAYAEVLEHWGNAKPRSKTADAARAHMKKLGCAR